MKKIRISSFGQDAMSNWQRDSFTSFFKPNMYCFNVGMKVCWQDSLRAVNKLPFYLVNFVIRNFIKVICRKETSRKAVRLQRVYLKGL